MKIKISDIESKTEKKEHISFSEVYDEFNKDIPVSADLNIEINGNIIKIYGNVKAVLNLTCDICLKEFTKELNFETEEYYIKNSLNDKYINEFEINENKFYEDLNGEDEIDISNFVYQCVILHIPNKLVCDINCNGDENLQKYIKKENSDPRLEIFKQIKIEKDKDYGSTKEENG